MADAFDRQHLVRALRRVLRPLVRLMLARGMTYPHVAEMLKEVFVDVAETEFRLDDRVQSDSRISLLSGVHRKDVRRLRGAPRDAGDALPAQLTLGAQLVTLWTGPQGFRDASGRPAALPRLASVGGERSFEALVARVSKDIRSRVVLDEWLRLGVASLNEDDEVVLNTDAFVPRADFGQMAGYFAHNLGDHAAAAVHNLLAEGTPWLERSAHFDALGAEGAQELGELAATAGMAALQALAGRAQELEARDAAEAGPKRRITFGVYFYSDAAGQDPEGENGA